MSAGDINMKEFARAIKYYMHAFECSKERPGELNKKEFVLFWEKFKTRPSFKLEELRTSECLNLKNF